MILLTGERFLEEFGTCTCGEEFFSAESEAPYTTVKLRCLSGHDLTRRWSQGRFESAARARMAAPKTKEAA